MGKRPAAAAAAAAGEKPDEKRHKGFDEVGAALKMLERPLLKRDPADEHKELVEAMQVWQEEAELGEEIQKRHAAKPKAQGRWNRKDRAEDEAELMRAAKAARVEVVEKEEEEECVKDEEGEYVEKEKDGLEEELGEPGGEGQEEERQEQDEEVNPDEMEGEGQEGHEQPETEENDDDGHQKKAGWWGHGQGWWKRPWHKGKGKHHGGWQPRQHKPHWASWKSKQKDFSGKGKGTGKGKFDAWGGEYCVGGYKDLAGNFYERL